MIESKMLKEMWTNGKKPELKEPSILTKNNGVQIISNNENSSIGWRTQTNKKWNIYKDQEIINPGDNFEILVFKPGYGSIIKTYD